MITASTASFAHAKSCNESEQIRALALNMYHEARGEGFDAMQMVGEVTLNRVENKNFPNNICKVVYQSDYDSKGNPIRRSCQFSWYCDGKSDKPKDRESWKLAVEIATGLVRGSIDLIGIDATHYHTKSVNPYWSNHYDRIGYYGGHVFYKMGDRL